MITRRAALALGLYVCAAAASARADDTGAGGPPRVRLSFGAAAGPMLLGVTADGRSINEPVGGEPSINATLGLDAGVVSWFAVGVEGRVGTWDTQWSRAAGYADQSGRGNRTLFDLDAVMRFRFPMVRSFQTRPLVFSLAPTVGFTWPQAPSRETRAVTERWQPRRGSNAGIELTCESWFTPGRGPWRFGVALGVGYVRRWLTLDEEVTPISQPDAAVSTRYQYVSDQLLFKAALLAGF